MEFRVLGPIEVDVGAGPLPLGGPKQRAVLANLLVRANEVVPIDILIDEIWGDEPPGQARNTLQTYVSSLRKALGEGMLQGRAPGYVLVVDPRDIDATRFDALVRDARKILPVDPKVAIDTLEDALGMWRGPALADVTGHSLLAEAARLEELRVEAQEERISALLATGSAAQAIGELEPLLAHHPLRERLWEQLMLALYREGRQAEALAGFQRARELLADELGIDPSPELVRLQGQILAQDPSLELRGEPLRGYRLLEKLGESHSGTRFRAMQPRVGRDVEIEIIREQIASQQAFVERFELEAQAVAALEHPHIVPIYDYWREPGRAYLVRRHLRGPSLRAMTERGESIDRNRALQIVEQVASALALAHRKGVAHGDVDDSHVVFDAEGNAYLGGFSVGAGSPRSSEDDIRRLGSIARRLLGRELPEPIAELIEREDGSRSDRAARFAEAARAALADPALPAAGALADDLLPNPYCGLRAFTEADAPDFFGRSAAVRQIIGRLLQTDANNRFIAVVGPSGCGKSSLVRAGVVPALRDGALGPRVLVTELSPGSHPYDELEAALGRIAIQAVRRLGGLVRSSSRGLLDAVDRCVPGGAEVVIVVDQFEELFTLTASEAERSDFLECLRVACADPESRIRVILTLRADFYDRPLVYPRFGELLAGRTVAVAPLQPDELDRAIRRPAERAGVRLEAGLVAEMIADDAHQPGALPLIQFALTELFDRRNDKLMKLSTYQEIGGIVGALSTSADEVVRQADIGEGRAIRQIFLRLVTLGEGRPDTRRKVARRRLDSLDLEPGMVDRILDIFGRLRIMTFDREPATREPTVEIAHEALLDAWPRLRGWIDEAREDLRQERLLTRATGEWIAARRDPSFLLRGARLSSTENWLASTDLAFERDVRTYLAASIDAREEERADDERRRIREAGIERRSARRLRALVAVFATAALVAGTLTMVATSQGERAEREAAVSGARELAAASATSLADDPERAVLLAIEAVERSRAATGGVIPEAEEALHRAVATSRIVATLGGAGDVLDWAPDGRIAAQEAPGSGTVEILDRTGAVVRVIDAHDGEITDVRFSPDGATLMTTGTDGWLRAWDLDLGVVRWQRHRHGRAMRVSLDAGGSLVAAAWDPGVDEGWLGGRVLVADAGTGETVWFKRLAHIKGGTRYAHDGTLSPDGSSIAVVADLARDTGVEIGRIIPLAGHGPSVRFRAPPWTGIGLLAWGPDGRLLSDGAHTWDATTGQLLFTASHEGSIVGVDWSPDGRRIVTASLDGTAKVWEVAATGPREPLVLSTAGGFAPVDDVSFSADGRFVITTSDVMRIWDAEPVGDADVAGLALPTTFEAQVAFKPSSSQLVVSSDAGLFTWRLGGTTLSPLGPPRPVPYWTVDVNPVDGSILRVDARSLSVLTPSEVRYLPVKGVLAAAWTPDGDHLVATSTDRSVALIDRDGHELWRTTMAHPIAGLRVGNDGRVAIAQGSEQDPNGGVVILDGHDGSVIATIPVRANALAFDAESSRIFVRGWGSLDPLTVWNADTGQQTDTLPLVAAQVSSIALSPDGSSLAVMAKDGLVRVYGANSGEVMVTLPSRSQVDPGFGTCFSQSMAFNPDGSRLATQGCDGVRVWVVDVDDLLAIARAEVTRSLSPDECRRYLHADPCPPPR